MSELAPRTRSTPLAIPPVIPLAEDVIATLRAHEPTLRAAGIQSLTLFGSVARGDADPGSDVDLAVAFDPAARVSLIDLVRLEYDIGDLLGRKVDLVPLPIEKARLRANLERDRKHVFQACPR